MKDGFEVKMFEVRDKATCIPVMAVHCHKQEMQPQAAYLMSRSGWTESQQFIYIMNTKSGIANYNAGNWDSNTMFIAHNYIETGFHELNDGQVIDVEFIQGFTKEPKASESTEHW
jgi:cold shock CspA family protein